VTFPDMRSFIAGLRSLLAKFVTLWVRARSFPYEPPTLGCLETVRYRTVYGWAHDPRQSRPMTLRIRINGEDAGVVVADRPRPELEEMGVASFRRGFEWAVPECIHGLTRSMS
jgi:hypothetical protein